MMRFVLVPVVLAILLGPAQAGIAIAQEMQLPVPVGMNGDPAAAIVLAGNSAFTHGDLNQAATDYRAALKRRPRFAVAAFNLGLVEVHQGDRESGITDMDRGIVIAREHGMSSAFIAHLRALRRAFTLRAPTVSFSA